jgi:hypothetical protein
MTCEADGYPEPETTVSTEDIKADLTQIKDAGSDGVVSVTCSAKNALNGENSVEGTVELEPEYVSVINCDWKLGARKKDPDFVSCTATGSGPDVQVKIYTESAGDKQSDTANPHELMATLGGRTPACEGSDPCEVKDAIYVFVVASLPGDVSKVESSAKCPSGQCSSARSSTTPIEKEGVPTWSHPKNDDINDPAKIRFWHSATADNEKPVLTEVTGYTEDEHGMDYPADGHWEEAAEKPANHVVRHIPVPSGGQYVVCYDLGDAADAVNNCDGDNFEQCADYIYNDQEKFCTFFSLPATSLGGMMWLWIIIVIILLIVIAAVVWWIRQKQANAGEDDEEDPKLEAHQIPGAEDADDDFEIQNEQSNEEKQPMINQDEQQSSN